MRRATPPAVSAGSARSTRSLWNAIETLAYCSSGTGPTSEVSTSTRHASKHRTDRCSEPDNRMLVVDVTSVFDAPDGRKHCLGETPCENSTDIQSQRGREAARAPLDGTVIDKQIRAFDRISKPSSELELDFADDAFGIDRQPAASVVENDVVVLQVAVQQARSTLRGAKISVHLCGFVQQISRNPN